jgi:hypothetical protein
MAILAIVYLHSGPAGHPITFTLSAMAHRPPQLAIMKIVKVKRQRKPRTARPGGLFNETA